MTSKQSHQQHAHQHQRGLKLDNPSASTSPTSDPVSPGFGALANRTSAPSSSSSSSSSSQQYLTAAASGIRGKPKPLKLEDANSPPQSQTASPLPPQALPNSSSLSTTANNSHAHASSSSTSTSSSSSSAAAAAAAANAVSPRRSMSASPITPRKKCAHSGCSSERFARGYCAAHLTSGFNASTPTSKIRNTYNLWSKSGISDDTSCQRVWKFADRDYSHTIILNEDLYTGEREITVNKKLAYKGFPDLGFWAIDIAIGQSFEKGTNCRIEVYPTMKGYDYELFIEDVKFDTAHANFLSNLSSVQLMQRMSSALDPIQEKAAQKKEKEYIQKNWQHMTEQDKTSMGYTKTRLVWKFTTQGQPHEVTLEHGHVGGKKKIWLDGNVVFEKKPGLLANKHKTFRHSFPVDKVSCEIIIQKNKNDGFREEDEDESSSSSSSSADKNAARPFIYELLVDGVPFAECTRTALDHAGGDIAIDQLSLRSGGGGPASSPSSQSATAPAAAATSPSGSAAASAATSPRADRQASVITNTRRKSLVNTMSADEVAEIAALGAAKNTQGAIAEEEDSWAKF